MKLLLLITVFITQLVSAQDVKIKYHTSYTRVTSPALVTHLTKANTYKLVFPEKLTYYASHPQMQVDGITFPYSDLYIKAKQVKDNAEIYLVVKTEGISHIDCKGVRQTVNGFVVDYNYIFPCNLVVEDATQKEAADYLKDNGKSMEKYVG